MRAERTDTREWKRVFEGVDETATRLYRLLDEQLSDRGLHEVLGDGEMDVGTLRERLGFDAGVAHRFGLALEALRNIGAVELTAGGVRAGGPRRAGPELDDELIAWTFGPLLEPYLDMYRSGAVFDPAFALKFDEGMDAVWDGLLNAPINRLPRDLAIDWVSSPGGRVLDLGFGTPDSLRQLAERVGDDGTVCGIDISPHFVERAREEFADVDAIGALACADANHGLPMFEPGSLDGVMFMGALHFVEDVDALFAELRRVMRDRTRLAVGMWFSDRPCFAGPALHLHRSFFDPPGVMRPEGEVVAALARAGFELRATVHVGSYCNLYLEQGTQVRAP
jgi:SAM-dependent methyltransferase